MKPKIIYRQGWYLVTNIKEEMLDWLSNTAARYNFVKAVEWCEKMNQRDYVWSGLVLDEIHFLFADKYDLSKFRAYVRGYLPSSERYVVVESKERLKIYRVGSAVWGLPVSICDKTFH